ncbi:MAG: hypothetical protein QJR06_04010 [Alicyclobacillaceae bacterium]|nr:hypothetical protein [Alicyclobacillaceae bacterium]
MVDVSGIPVVADAFASAFTDKLVIDFSEEGGFLVRHPDFHSSC